MDLLQRKAYFVKQSLAEEAGSVEGSCNISLMTNTKKNSLPNTTHVHMHTW